MASGVFIIASIGKAAESRVAAIQRDFDPKLAATSPPHLTIAGSSGVGPICAPVTVRELRAALEPIASTTAPLVLPFGPPHHFMQTTIVVLPLDPHGPLRVLHDRIAASGLPFERPRFTFTPHTTLSFHRTHDPETLKRLLAIRVEELAVIDRISVQLTEDPQPSKTLLELRLSGTTDGAGALVGGGDVTRVGARPSGRPLRRGARE